MREHYDGHIASKKRKQWEKETPRIAIVNQNRNKYTETFVQKHLKELPYNVYQIYGPNIPSIDSKRGNLINTNHFIYSIIKFWYSLLKRDFNRYIVKKLSSFFTREKINLFLCEFGPVANLYIPISKQTKIPLVVIFHGYDAWHKKILKQNNYEELFAEASAVIAVSKDICRQLKHLGCPKEKITYLPCSINFDLFKYTNHSLNPPIFLAVGRFAETKSPHLTILAFNEVLKEIPEAQLRMIGKDGGGELFEACHILVKALQIEDKVHFLGIKIPKEIVEEMKNARVFVQHSVTTPLMGDKEGTPVSIMEAMASGLPVVATKHAGIAEIIEHNKTGVLVEEYDYLNMAKEMIRVCKNDELIELLGKGASKDIQNNELIKNNSRILAEIIEKHRLK